jgi:predicted PurR-regulated permease PerM
VSTPQQRHALGVFAFVSVVALVWLSLPVASGLFLGTLLAFTLLRVHDRLSARIRPALSALLLAIASGVSIVGGLAGLLYFVVVRGIMAATALARGFEPEGSLRKMLEHFGESLQGSPFGHVDLVSRVRELAAEAASRLTGWAAAVAGATFTALLVLFFTIMTTFFVLSHWPEIIARAQRMLPLHPVHTRVVLIEFQKVGKEVFVGTMLTGLAQGFLAGIGYALGGVPEAALLGALTAICSLVPVIGTLIIWVPVGVGLILSGHLGAGVFVLLWGSLIVGVLSDYVIRPKLVGGRGHVPTLLTFISLFGGVELFGLLGLVVGPVIASVALALLRTYDLEICGPRLHEQGVESVPDSIIP